MANNDTNTATTTESQTRTTVHASDFDGDFNTITLKSSHPLYLHPSDHTCQILVSASLTGDNFNEWKRSMSLALSALFCYW